MNRIHMVYRILVAAGILAAAFRMDGQVKNPKRGIAYGYHSEEDLKAISGSLSWWYNWANTPDAGVAGIFEEYDMDFTPMAWNNRYDVNKLREFYAGHPEAKYLLGFNEPNFREQANMTPSEAAAAWPGLEAIADEFGLELVGPAVNWCGNCVSEGGVTFTDPYEYLDSFFVACTGCRVDYIAVHNYMCYSGPIIDYLEGFRKYGKKIWLTEFACWDQATITLDMQKNLVIGALNHLDNDTLVYRYSWFTGRSGEGTPHIDLYGSEPGELTELGELYVHYNPVHDTSLYIPVPARIEAENYSTMEGIALEGTTDFDGLANVGWIDGGDWLEYNIHNADTGNYYVYLRIAATATSTIDLLVDDTLSATVNVSSTGGWQNWTTLKGQVSLGEGNMKLRLYTPSGNFNINWLRVSTQDNQGPSCSAGEDFQVFYPEASVLLMGEGSDPDGDSLVYRWEQLGGAECRIESPEMPVTNLTGLEPGMYRFRLTVSDGYEVTYDEVRIRVLENTAGWSESSTGNLEVFPNPTTGKFLVTLPEMHGNGLLQVLNATGQLFISRDLTGTRREIELDVSRLGNGLYFLKLESERGSRMARFIKTGP